MVADMVMCFGRTDGLKEEQPVLFVGQKIFFEKRVMWIKIRFGHTDGRVEILGNHIYTTSTNSRQKAT